MSLFLNIFTQIIAYKYILKRGLLKSEYLGCLCGFTFLFICAVYLREELFQEWLAMILVNLAIYVCLSYGYFSFITFGETARRARLLYELRDFPDGLSKEELLKRYNAQEAIALRVARLLANGQIILRDGRYYIGSPIVLIISKIIVFLKVILLAKRSEFENSLSAGNR